MVRSCTGIILAFVLVSCGSAPFTAGGLEQYDEVLESEDAVPGEMFETIERFRDNPVDPGKAGMEELLSIPGFPVPLAEKVMLATRGRRSGRSWIDELTPPERALLYRFSDFLRLPERQSTSARARITEGGAGLSGRRRTDARAALAGDGWQVIARSRDFDLPRRSSFYAAFTERSGILRLHCGSFAPDIAMGLVFGEDSGAASFSGAFPLWDSRWISGSTSFYGRSLCGGAAELWYRSVRAALMLGRPRTYRSDRFESEEHIARLACIELRRGLWDMGACAVDGGDPAGKARYSVSATVTARGLRAGFESAGDGSGEPAVSWGVSYRSGRTKSAVRFHAIPPGSSGRWSAIDGRAVTPTFSDAGIAATTESVVLPGLRVRASIERFVKADGFEDDTRTAVRVECERRGRRARARLTWSSRTDGTRNLVPWPGDADCDHDHNGSIAILTEATICRWLAGKISARYSKGEGHSGVLVSPSFSLGILSGRLRLTGMRTEFRSLTGKQTHYLYEPSLEGVYPWITVSGSGARHALRINLNCNMLCIALKVAHEGERRTEVALQAAFRLE